MGSTGRRSKRFLAEGKSILIFVGILWVIEVLNLITSHSLNRLGLQPRSMVGLIGIPLSPFLHGSVTHLLSNTPPLLILGFMICLRGTASFVAYSFQIAMIGGMGVWLFGRSSIHVGASGLLFGYFGFLVASAWFERKPLSIALALLALFLYSGLIWGVLPSQPFVSWESHLCGLIAGIIVARLQASPGK